MVSEKRSHWAGNTGLGKETIGLIIIFYLILERWQTRERKEFESIDSSIIGMPAWFVSYRTACTIRKSRLQK